MLFFRGPEYDPRINLAFEETLHRSVRAGDEGIFLLWRNAPTVVVGRFQDTAEEVREDIVNDRRIGVVRRITGGGAVYHDLGNVNYSFLFPGTATGTLDFAPFTAPILRALRRLGVPAERTDRNDLTILGRKFSGNAQHMDGHRILHHGTLLFDSDLSVLSDVLRVREDKYRPKGFASVASRVTNIRPHLGAETGMEDFFVVLKDEVEREYGLSPLTVTDEFRGSVRRLAEERYASRAWTWGDGRERDVRKERRFEGVGRIEVRMDIRNGVMRNVAFFGDFFGAEDLTPVAQALDGLPLENAAVKGALAPLDIGSFFYRVREDELVSFLCF